METRARYALIGLFMLAVILASFAFVYWLENKGGFGKRDIYQVRFQGSVSGLLVGSAVLFNGLRVGEVTRLSLSADRPQDVVATIAVVHNTPVRDDTEVTIETQGLDRRRRHCAQGRHLVVAASRRRKAARRRCCSPRRKPARIGPRRRATPSSAWIKSSRRIPSR